ncbi:glycosyltransferase family 2 protein [Methanosphaera sp.]
MIKTKVSIIIPVYNSSKYLLECLDSIKRQTLTDFEVICIDDNSTDDSLNILKKYADNDQRFKVLQQEHKGPGAARNKGIREASGEYILFIDSDDWIEKDTLDTLYTQASKTNSDLVLFNGKEHYNDDKTRDRIYPVKSYVDEDKVFNYNDTQNLS